MLSENIEEMPDLSVEDAGMRWTKIATTLRHEIDTGILVPGQQIAPELNLSQRFGVSRSTVRRAVAELEKQGVIRIEHGRGLFVSEDVVPYVISPRTRFSENMRRLNLTGERRILEIHRKVPDDAIRDQLELSAGDEVFFVESIVLVQGRPLGIVKDYHPAQRFPEFAEMMFRHNSSTEALKALGVQDYKRQKTLILSRLPNSREARLLKVARSRPVLEMQKLDVDLNNVPVAFGISCNCADRIQFFIE